jgi:hypothetical protein
MAIFRRLIPQAGQEPFIIEVTVTAGQIFTLPLISYGPNPPNFFVDWGDGSAIQQITSVTDTDRVHTYITTGVYEIVMQGFIPGWSVNNSAIRNLITAVIDWGRTGMGKINFFGCTNLTSIPSNADMILNGGTDEDGDGNRNENGIGYAGLANVKDFSGFMKQTSLSAIPSGLFDFAVLASDFSDAFASTPISSVPSGLFDENVLAQTFASCFIGCINLTTVPLDLFANNTQVLSFAGTFRNCINISSGVIQFAENTSVTEFDAIYQMFTTSNSISGTAPTLWLRNPRPTGFAAFRNCVNLTNFADIPADFK